MRVLAPVFLAPIVLVMLLASPAAGARDNFVTSRTTPYPPGCISNDNQGISTPSGGRRVYNDSSIMLSDASSSSNITVNLLVARRGCIEPNRSVLLLQIQHFTPNSLVAIPRIFIEVGGTRYPMRLVAEPNTFETNQSGTIVGLGTYDFVVDGLAEGAVTANTPILSPTQYDGEINLIVQDANNINMENSLPLPAWNAQITPVRYPLNGRLSGVWVSEGAVNQGFVVSFSELVSDTSIQQLAFFSWYTYAADGSPLWLSSSQIYDINASSVELPMRLLTNGQFLGGAVPEDQPLGVATLTARSCSEMTLEYDLQDLGLGAGTITLERSFALETAGYACNDLEARLGGD